MGNRESLTNQVQAVLYLFIIPLLVIGVLLIIEGGLLLEGVIVDAKFDTLGIISLGLGFIAIGLALQGTHRTEHLLDEMRKGEIYEKIAMIYGYAGDVRSERWPNKELVGDGADYAIRKILSDIKSMRNVAAAIGDNERTSLNEARAELDKQLRAKHYDAEADEIKKELDEMIAPARKNHPGREFILAGLAVALFAVGVYGENAFLPPYTPPPLYYTLLGVAITLVLAGSSKSGMASVQSKLDEILRRVPKP